MVHPFIEYLVEKQAVPPDRLPRRTGKPGYVREPIGMIAVEHGLLQTTLIEVILDRQRTCNSRFGDIAIELGALTRHQVETLLKTQEFRTSARIAESLALAGILSHEQAVHQLGSFLVRDREVEAMISGM